MRHSWRDVPALLRTPIGRIQFVNGLYYRAWPLLSRLATLYRQTILRRTSLVAVVGSFGKTTTARALIWALGGDLSACIVPNYWSFVAGSVLRIPPLHRHAVIEVGIDGPGQMVKYAHVVRPNITVVTSIGSEHNRSLPSLEVTRMEKSEMVRVLPRAGIAVLNGDDPNVLWMKNETNARVLTFGLSQKNDFWVSDVALDWPRGTRFRLHALGETHDMHVRLIGRIMVYPILAAITVALAEGFGLDKTLSALEMLPPTSGRLEPIRLPSGAFILNDEFKSNLETVHTALDVLSEIPAVRRTVVLGDVSEPPGSTGPMYRNIGERLARVASNAIFITRSKRGYQNYATGARRGGLASSSVVRIHENVLKAV